MGKHFFQQIYDLILLIKSPHLHNLFKFTFIKPDAMVFYTSIEQYFVSSTAVNLLHFLPADRAFKDLFTRILICRKGIQQLCFFFRILQKQFKLAAIKPDAVAAGTVVDLNLV